MTWRAVCARPCVTVHTILEIYKISDMSLVRVLPSAEDEVNVACFHPLPGGGGLHSSTCRLNISAFCGIGGVHLGVA